MDDDLWGPAPPNGMRHSSSELDFRRFMQEAFLGAPCNGVTGIQPGPGCISDQSYVNRSMINTPHFGNDEGVVNHILDFNGEFRDDHPVTEGAEAAGGRLPPCHAVEDEDPYQAYLKSRLELECRAVALLRERTSEAPLPPVDAATLQLSPGGGSSQQDSSSALQIEEADTSILHVLASTKSRGQSITSTESSVGQSDELDEDDERAEATDQNSDTPNSTSNDKRMRRKLSNRESARRSRRRKHDLKTDLEGRVAQLEEEKCNLLKQLTEIIQKSNQQAADNKILKPQVDQLRSQVRLLEEKVAKLPLMRGGMARRPMKAASELQNGSATHHQSKNIPFPNSTPK